MGRVANLTDAGLKHDRTADRVRKYQTKLKLVEYRVEGGDIIILSGPYAGQSATEVFLRGPNERDYVVKNLCMRNDAKVLEIIRSLCGN